MKFELIYYAQPAEIEQMISFIYENSPYEEECEMNVFYIFSKLLDSTIEYVERDIPRYLSFMESRIHSSWCPCAFIYTSLASLVEIGPDILLTNLQSTGIIRSMLLNHDGDEIVVGLFSLLERSIEAEHQPLIDYLLECEVLDFLSLRAVYLSLDLNNLVTNLKKLNPKYNNVLMTAK